MNTETPHSDGRPLAYDLFCGYGGWTRGLLDAGYRVVGFDNEPKCATRYPGEFRHADVRNIDGRELRGARLMVLSPPCNKFSLVAGRARDVEAGMVLVREAKRIIDEAQPTYWALENVRGAYRAISAFLGPPKNPGGMANASIYLWGNFPPCILPRVRKGFYRPNGSPPGTWTGSTHKHSDQRERAIVPYQIARAIGDACLPTPEVLA